MDLLAIVGLRTGSVESSIWGDAIHVTVYEIVYADVLLGPI